MGREAENEYSCTCLRPMVVIAIPCMLPFRSPREPEHLEKHPDYPDPYYYLNPTSKYFFRAQALQHLRTVKGLQELPTWPWAFAFIRADAHPETVSSSTCVSMERPGH